MVSINIPADGLALAVLKLIDNDFSEATCRKAVKAFIDNQMTANPDTIMLNICYRRSFTPSDVFDSVLYNVKTDENGVCIKEYCPENSMEIIYYMQAFLSGCRAFEKNNIDIIGFAIEEIKLYGCDVWLSVRMNDHHNLENPAINSSFALNGEIDNLLENGHYDYSKKCVQNYYLEYIKEQVRRYDVDGIELDWLRTPPVLPDKLCEDYNILTDFHSIIREELNLVEKEKNRNISLGVRVLATEKENMHNGMDVSSWVSSGAVDIVTVANFFVPTNYEIPVKAWQNSIADKNINNHPYKLLCGCDWGVRTVSGKMHYMSTAMMRGFVSSALNGGADGVYLFNLFEEDSIVSKEFYITEGGLPDIRDCFTERLRSVNLTSELPRRYIHIGAKHDRYPFDIKSKNKYSFNVNSGNTPSICRILLASSHQPQVEIHINGNICEEQTKTVKRYDLNFDNKDTALQPCEFGNKVIYADLPIKYVKDGNNLITIKNIGNTDLIIEWIEVICE